MSGKVDLSDYVDVAERIRQFATKYPDGSLQSEITMVDGGVLAKAYAYRSPDDPTPGVGHAYEPVPGKTPFTRDSEVMNAETSAWGRAIVALGFETKKIASADEVQNRRGDYLPETRVEPSAKRPESWAALAAGFNVLDVDPEWLKQAVFYKFGKDRTELDQGEKELAFQMLAGVLMRLQDGEYGPPEMFGFSREQLQQAFAGPLDGQVLDGPPWCVGMENPENSGRLGKAQWLEAQTVPGEEDIPFGEEGDPDEPSDGRDLRGGRLL